MEGRRDALRLDRHAGRLWRGETVVSLRPKTLSVLRYLEERAHRAVGREELFRALWPRTHVSATVLKVCVREIRSALEDDASSPRFLATSPGGGYRWIGPRIDSEPDGAASRAGGGSILVGREAELSQIREAYARARRGARQVVFVTGQAGLGKTALADAFAGAVAAAEDVLVARGQSVELYGPGEPYLPVLEALGDLARGLDGPRIVGHLERHAPTWLVQMPGLVEPSDLVELRRRSADGTSARMLREIAEALEAASRERPLVLVLEDLHWSDLSTVDLIGSLARRRAPARLLLIATYRPVDAVVRDHPVRVLRQELLAHEQCEEIALPPLVPHDVDAYLATRFPGHRLPPELACAIHRGGDGSPLFMVDLLNELSTRAVIGERDGVWQLLGGIRAVEETIPGSLRALVERQLERLSDEERSVLEAASVAGETFAASTVAAALGTTDAALEEIVDRFARRGLLIREAADRTSGGEDAGGGYEFLHGLHRKIVYDRMPRAARRRLHRRIGERLETVHGARPETAGQLATHFAFSGDPDRAIRYLTIAGDGALSRFASREAIGYFEKALEIFSEDPGAHGGPARELHLLLRLGGPLLGERGFASPAVRRLYGRARELCAALGDEPRMPPILVGLFTAHLTAGELEQARAVAEDLGRCADALADPTFDALAGFASGFVAFYGGDVRLASRELERVTANRDRIRPAARIGPFWLDPAVACTAQSAWAHWIQGRSDRALEVATDALALARTAGAPFDVCLALLYLGTTRLLRGEAEEAEVVGRACLAEAEEYGLGYWRSGGKLCSGAAAAARGRTEDGLALLRQGIAEWRAGAAPTGLTLWLSLLAERLLAEGDPDAAAEAVREAFALVEENGERCWEAELHRVRGAVGLALGRPDAEASLRHAVEIARRQGAGALERRAAASLARALAERAPARRIRGRLAALRADGAGERSEGTAVARAGARRPSAPRSG